MKALAIDCASRKMAVGAKNGDAFVTITLEGASIQSKQLLPAIDFALKSVELSPAELEFSTLCAGPGTFTGLRIAFSALKALTLSHGIPIFQVPTLFSYAKPFFSEAETVISVIDAKKDQFFVSIYKNGTEIFPVSDTTPEKIVAFLKENASAGKIFALGPSAPQFSQILNRIEPNFLVKVPKFLPPTTDALLEIAAELKKNGESPLNDYDGPVYIRASEAELSLAK